MAAALANVAGAVTKLKAGKNNECVKVVVRCRPLFGKELKENRGHIIGIDSPAGMVSITNPNDEKGGNPKSFTFDYVYGEDSQQKGVYEDVAFPLVESVMEGFNGTVFAYGQTGCGKTHTMQGKKEPPEMRGIIPNAFVHIFENIDIADDNMEFLVRCSYLEIYNEEVRDLLGANVKDKLDLKEDPGKGVYVKGLTDHVVGSVDEIEAVMERGFGRRSVAATQMNAESSRSHSIFTIIIEVSQKVDGKDAIRAGKLNLVDLAGSERQSKTGATGARLKEGSQINLSLSALGNVISALVDGKGKHIPYRDSKLTRLLQDSLGGNTKTVMIAAISPADYNYDETMSTLRYANRAKNIKNKPKVNEDPKDTMLRQMKEEIEILKQQLAAAASGTAAPVTGVNFGNQGAPAITEYDMKAEIDKAVKEAQMSMQKEQAQKDAEMQQKLQEALKEAEYARLQANEGMVAAEAKARSLLQEAHMQESRKKIELENGERVSLEDTTIIERQSSVIVEKEMQELMVSPRTHITNAREEAEKHRANAREEAEKHVAAAKLEAARILEDAQNRKDAAEKDLHNAQTAVAGPPGLIDGSVGGGSTQEAYEGVSSARQGPPSGIEGTKSQSGQTAEKKQGGVRGFLKMFSRKAPTATSPTPRTEGQTGSVDLAPVFEPSSPLNKSNESLVPNKSPVKSPASNLALHPQTSPVKAVHGATTLEDGTAAVKLEAEMEAKFLEKKLAEMEAKLHGRKDVNKELKRQAAAKKKLALKLKEEKKQKARLELEKHRAMEMQQNFLSQIQATETKMKSQADNHTEQYFLLQKELDKAREEMADMAEEFQQERTQLLDTIRNQAKEVKLMEQVMEKVFLPREIGKLWERSVYNEDHQKWSLPTILKARPEFQNVKLPGLKIGGAVGGAASGRTREREEAHAIERTGAESPFEERGGDPLAQQRPSSRASSRAGGHRSGGRSELRSRETPRGHGAMGDFQLHEGATEGTIHDYLNNRWDGHSKESLKDRECDDLTHERDKKQNDRGHSSRERGGGIVRRSANKEREPTSRLRTSSDKPPSQTTEQKSSKRGRDSGRRHREQGNDGGMRPSSGDLLSANEMKGCDNVLGGPLSVNPPSEEAPQPSCLVSEDRVRSGGRTRSRDGNRRKKDQLAMHEDMRKDGNGGGDAPNGEPTDSDLERAERERRHQRRRQRKEREARLAMQQDDASAKRATRHEKGERMVDEFGLETDPFFDGLNEFEPFGDDRSIGTVEKEKHYRDKEHRKKRKKHRSRSRQKDRDRHRDRDRGRDRDRNRDREQESRERDTTTHTFQVQQNFEETKGTTTMGSIPLGIGMDLDVGDNTVNTSRISINATVTIDRGDGSSGRTKERSHKDRSKRHKDRLKEGGSKSRKDKHKARKEKEVQQSSANNDDMPDEMGGGGGIDDIDVGASAVGLGRSGEGGMAGGPPDGSTGGEQQYYFDMLQNVWDDT